MLTQIRKQFRHPLSLFGLAAGIAVTVVGWWAYQPAAPAEFSLETGASTIRWSAEPIQPIPADQHLNPAKVQLGERLFLDPALSHDNQVACAACHNMQTNGADSKRFSIGVNGASGTINSPTVFNSGLNARLNWTGSFENLMDHVDSPLLNPTVMGSNWNDVIRKLQLEATYRHEFAALYPEGITPATVRDALVVYQASLLTPNSRFDRYLKGDSAALSADEKEGYDLFKSYGCVSCHQGVNIGGNMFQRFGVLGDYFANRGKITPTDWGRYQVTGNEQDRFVFRVPSLRNVALTAPYFHDGTAETLDEAIAVMSTYQLGRSLSTTQIQCIKKFLETLTGEYKGKRLEPLATAQPSPSTPDGN